MLTALDDFTITINVKAGNYNGIQVMHVRPTGAVSITTPATVTDATISTNGVYTYVVVAPEVGLHKVTIFNDADTNPAINANSIGYSYFNVVSKTTTASMSVG